MPAKLLSSAEQLSCSPEGKKNGLRSYHTSKGKILTNPCPRRPPPHYRLFTTLPTTAFTADTGKQEAHLGCDEMLFA